MPAKIFPDQLYGELREGLHVAGYTLERAFHRLETLLTDDAWKKCGGGFADAQVFLSSLHWDRFEKTAEDRKRLVKLIKEKIPEVTIRQIAKTVGSKKSTIGRDLSQSGTGGKKKAKQNNGAVSQSGTPIPGADAAKVVARAERVSGQQQSVNERVERNRARSGDAVFVGDTVDDRNGAEDLRGVGLCLPHADGLGEALDRARQVCAAAARDSADMSTRRSSSSRTGKSTGQCG
jgi:hypothetical protein